MPASTSSSTSEEAAAGLSPSTHVGSLGRRFLTDLTDNCCVQFLALLRLAHCENTNTTAPLVKLLVQLCLRSDAVCKRTFEKVQEAPADAVGWRATNPQRLYLRTGRGSHL